MEINMDEIVSKTDDYTVTFATFNCIDYTKKCIDSLFESGIRPDQIVVVDNGSSDGTQEYLAQLDLGATIFNRENLSCGVAWNQGILARQSEWTIVMNNDVVVPPNFAERLIAFAKKQKLLLVSPSRIDGSMDYDYTKFVTNAQITTEEAIRYNSSNAVCMCIHWSLFIKIGFFTSNPTLLGFEDGLFYKQIRNFDIRHATTGSVWIHHFGSVTQDHLKMILGKSRKDVIVKVNDRKLYGESILERKIYRFKLKKNHKMWRKIELKKYGISLHGTRVGNEFLWL